MKKIPSNWLRPAAIGPQFVVAIFFGWWFGSQCLDKWFDTKPIFTIIFTGFGLAAGFVNLFREVKVLEAELEREKRSASNEEPQERKGSDKET